MKENLEKIRQAVIKANPEIMELKPGCLLDLHAGESYGLVEIHREISVCKKHKKYREECGAEEDGCSVEDAVFGTSGNDECWWQFTLKVSEIKPYQILGRPIRLADVLAALNERYPDYKLHHSAVEGSHELAKLLKLYNLKDDNLENQSEETIAFLASLLSNNN